MVWIVGFDSHWALLVVVVVVDGVVDVVVVLGAMKITPVVGYVGVGCVYVGCV